MATVTFENGQSVTFKGTPSQKDIDEVALKLGIKKKEQSKTINALSDVPVLGQLSNAGIGIGSALGKFATGAVSSVLRGASAAAPYLPGTGLIPQDALKSAQSKLTGAAQSVDDFGQSVYQKPFQKSLETTSGQVGMAIGSVAPYLATAGVVNPATAGLSTIPRIAARTLPDVAISAAQSGGDLKTMAGTGVTSAVTNALLPGPLKGVAAKPIVGLLDKSKQVAKEIAPGYVSDVATGLAGQRGEDRTGFSSLIPGTGTALAAGLSGATRAVSGVRGLLDKDARAQATIQKREKDIFDIENNYVKTRKNIDYSKDSGSASRKRVAETDVLVGSVDENGTMRTKQKGGPIDQYKAQTIDGKEGTVRENLVREGGRVNLAEVDAKLNAEVNASRLEGEDLTRAQNGVKREVAALRKKADANGTVATELLHDSKINQTNNINFQTPPETSTYRKALARGYKALVEKYSRAAREANPELAKYMQDIELLENLDGKKVEGGRLGKHFARISGNIIGGAVGGAVGGPLGAGVGTMLGGEATGFLKGKSMAGSLGKATGRTAPKNPILERVSAEGKSPRLALPAPREGAPRIQMESGPAIKLPARTLRDEVQSNNLGTRNTIYSAPKATTAKVNIPKPILSKKNVVKGESGASFYHGTDTGKLKVDKFGNINLGTEKNGVLGFGKVIQEIKKAGFNIQYVSTKEKLFEIVSGPEKFKLLNKGVDIVVAENHAIAINPDKLSKRTGLSLEESLRGKTIDDLRKNGLLDKSNQIKK